MFEFSFRAVGVADRRRFPFVGKAARRGLGIGARQSLGLAGSALHIYAACRAAKIRAR